MIDFKTLDELVNKRDHELTGLEYLVKYASDEYKQVLAYVELQKYRKEIEELTREVAAAREIITEFSHVDISPETPANLKLSMGGIKVDTIRKAVEWMKAWRDRRSE